jgi:hypothetical protein
MKNAVFWDVATSVLTRATQCNIPEDEISHHLIKLLALLCREWFPRSHAWRSIHLQFYCYKILIYNVIQK